MSFNKQTANKPNQKALGMGAMHSRTHSRGPTSSANGPSSDPPVHHPQPSRATAGNVFASSKPKSNSNTARISSDQSDSTAVNTEPANYDPLDLGGFDLGKSSQRRADVPDRPHTRAGHRSNTTTNDLEAVAARLDVRRSKTPAPTLPQGSQERIHLGSTINEPLAARANDATRIHDTSSPGNDLLPAAGRSDGRGLSAGPETERAVDVSGMARRRGSIPTPPAFAWNTNKKEAPNAKSSSPVNAVRSSDTNHEDELANIPSRAMSTTEQATESSTANGPSPVNHRSKLKATNPGSSGFVVQRHSHIQEAPHDVPASARSRVLTNTDHAQDEEMPVYDNRTSSHYFNRNKPPMERRVQELRETEDPAEVGHKRRLTPDRQEGHIHAPTPRVAATNRLPTHSSVEAYEEDENMDYYGEEGEAVEPPFKRSRSEGRPIVPVTYARPHLEPPRRRSATYDETDDRNYRAPADYVPDSDDHSEQMAAYYENADLYERRPTSPASETDVGRYASPTPVPPEPKNKYDTQAYMNQNMEKYEKLKEKWRECTHEEWVAGGQELVEQFKGIMKFVTDHMETKIKLYTKLHEDLDGHVNTLDERDRRLVEVQAQLANGAEGVIGSSANPITL